MNRHQLRELLDEVGSGGTTPEAAHSQLLQFLRQAPFEALLTGFCGPLVLGLLRRIDGRIDSTRSRVGLARGPRTMGDGMTLR